MVKIRLKRFGSKKNPVFRVIVIDSREKREGKAIEELGFYNPKTKEMQLKKENAISWITKGAQLSETVKYLIENCDANGNLIKKEQKPKKLSKKALAKTKAEKENQAKEEVAAE